MNTFVSKIHLPDKQRLLKYIDGIYESRWLTNNGPLVQELERRLQDYLGVKNLLVTTSGTTALQLAIKTLDLDGEAITTPFTFPATSGALAAEHVRPVYVDIDRTSFNLDPALIEASITPRTSAIVPVHVFGNPCAIEEIEAIAARHGLKVLYDASHAFGVTYDGRSVLSHGNISTLSFHATKFFHTVEGGAIVVNDDELYAKARAIRAYGMDGPESVAYVGINAKMNEFQAAMGLCNLDEIDSIVAEIRDAHDYYRDRLSDLVVQQEFNSRARRNYSYFAALFQDHDEMDAVRANLRKIDVYARQYFFPSLDGVEAFGVHEPMVNSRDIADRILVLPLHSGAEVRVCDTIRHTVRV